MSLTAEQRAIRETGIGSSEIAAVVGVNPWRSALDVFWSKPTPARPAIPIEGDEASATGDAGNEFEEPIVRLYAKRMGVKLKRAGTLRHRKEPWILATPDRLVVGERRGVEAKLVGSRVAHHWDDGVPDYVTVQVDWQMLVLDYDVWDVVMMTGTDARILTVNRDAEREALLVEAAREFWFNYVLTDTPPPPVSEDERTAYLKRRYPRPTDEMVPSTPEVDAIVARYLAAQRAEEDAAERKQAAANDLLDWLGERRGVRGEWGSASAPLVRDRVDWKALAHELAGGEVAEAIIERHRGEPSRRLGVYPKRTKAKI